MPHVVCVGHVGTPAPRQTNRPAPVPERTTTDPDDLPPLVQLGNVVDLSEISNAYEFYEQQVKEIETSASQEMLAMTHAYQEMRKISEEQEEKSNAVIQQLKADNERLRRDAEAKEEALKKKLQTPPKRITPPVMPASRKPSIPAPAPVVSQKRRPSIVSKPKIEE